MSVPRLSEDITHPEIVVGLVGPIGVNMDDIQSSLSAAFLAVGYQAEIVHITKALKKYTKREIKGTHKETKYGQKIDTANAFCETAENGAALAALAIAEIRETRKRINGSDGARAIPKRAYIIRQLKRFDEIELLRHVYGDKFLQISVSLEKDKRVENLITRLGKDHPQMRPEECEKYARELISVDEFEEHQTFGQQVGDIFHLGDYFVDAGKRDRISTKLQSFLRAFFGDNAASPSRDEFGAYMAASAALRSVDLSRQVGSAILNPSGDLIAIGCNEVPKANGGNYWIGDGAIARDIERGVEQNSLEKQRIIVDFIKKLQTAGFVKIESDFDKREDRDKLGAVANDALISDITEYGRMTHAEMSAICDAARLGLSVSGATIFVTTFPCHNCAKHIVACGIKRVVFIEPYPKSKASSSHTDSIVLGSSCEDKVAFENFEGISPKRYRDIFQKGKRRSGATINEWYEGEPRPRIAHRDNLHVGREAVAATTILRKMGKKPETQSSDVNRQGD